MQLQLHLFIIHRCRFTNPVSSKRDPTLFPSPCAGWSARISCRMSAGLSDRGTHKAPVGFAAHRVPGSVLAFSGRGTGCVRSQTAQGGSALRGSSLLHWRLQTRGKDSQGQELGEHVLIFLQTDRNKDKNVRKLCCSFPQTMQPFTEKCPCPGCPHLATPGPSREQDCSHLNPADTAQT